jgi:uncharacterized membrane protein
MPQETIPGLTQGSEPRPATEMPGGSVEIVVVPVAAGAVASLMIFIATLVVCVVASVADYAAERDWLFVALTGSVLAILVRSFLVPLGS